MPETPVHVVPVTVPERVAFARVLARLGLRRRSSSEVAVAAALRELAELLLDDDRDDVAQTLQDCAMALESPAL
ncbi:MAG: hypothetical protein U0168_04740 [Nannocystaceae bacterium]|jgi:hypothetical protein